MQATCGEKEETDSSCESVATARGSLLVLYFYEMKEKVEYAYCTHCRHTSRIPTIQH